MVQYLIERVRGLWAKKEGASLVEYGLLIALIAVACIAALSFLAGGIGNVFNYVGTRLNAST